MKTTSKKDKIQLADEAFCLQYYELLAILNDLSIPLRGLSRHLYPNSDPDKLWFKLYRMHKVPSYVIEGLINLVGERAYRIAYNSFVTLQKNRAVPKHLIVPEEPDKPKEIEIKTADKPNGKIIFHAKKDNKEPVTETSNKINWEVVKNEELTKDEKKEPAFIKPDKPKRKYKRKPKTPKLSDSAKPDPIQEQPKQPDPPKPDTLPDPGKNIFQKIGVPLSDLNLKK